MGDTLIEVSGLTHRYESRLALDGVSFSVNRGEIFGLLGPNGGGKTTLFKILSTLIRPSAGEATIAGHSLRGDPSAVRRHLGVVFQQPSVDGKLTVEENLVCHGHLYNIGGTALQQRVGQVLDRLALADRRRELVERLSGGLQRRVELAKSLLQQPPLLILDEPSTGLDPGARRDFVNYLRQLRERDGVTIVLTTHLMDEAERCDRIGILHQGSLVKIGVPDELKAHVGGDVVVLQSAAPEDLAAKIRERFGVSTQLVDGSVRVERERGHELVRDVVDAFPAEVTSVTYGKPTLEDAFIHFTGHRFWSNGEEAEASA
ncbi:MAG TPA: ATP-binding cassette domain-containing protein [Terriglobales bacterium]|nr:ATP-binding cassette domain-containing protein [Terriglobales bacterium]